MRIVAGSARGRRIDTVPGAAVRPTSERVREAIFNTLYSTGGVADRSVLDLFAGSGALGLEALSRGAGSAVFVERNTQALDVVRGNVERLGFAERAEIVRADAVSYVHRRVPVDVALIDPPYAFEDWSSVLSEVTASLLVLESDRSIDPGPGWVVFKEGRYSGTVVTFAHRPELERP